VLKRITEFPYHAFVLAVHPVLGLFENNETKVPISDALGTMLYVEAVLVLVLGLCWWLTRRLAKAGLLTLLVVIFVLFYQHLFDLLTPFGGQFEEHVYFLPLWLVAAVLAFRVAAASTARLITTTLVLNVGALFFVASPALQVAHYQLKVGPERGPAIAAINRPVPELKPSGQKPDIYYLVFDRYARADVLQQVYGYDNSEFLTALGDRGFGVIERSAANYQRTSHSLAASLNMTYLDAIGESLGERSDDWVLIYRLLEDYKVWRALKGVGYRFIHFGTWWKPTAANRFADENVNWKAIPTFDRFFWAATAPGRLALMAGLSWFDYRSHQCERLKHKFARLEEVAAAPGPKFVFAHVLLPHPPFIFDAEGRCLSRAEAQARSREQNYIGQLTLTNRLLLAAIDKILVANENAVIVVQADEGPWPASIAGDEQSIGMDTTPAEWAAMTPAETKEKVAIFNAIRLPGAEAELYPVLTPVNTFRIIFNRYFGSDFVLLPDESYIYLDNKPLYDFVPVTEVVR
jgi:hypothetical protein